MFYGLFAYGAAAAVVQWGLPDDPMPASLAAVYLLIVAMVLTMTAALSLHANAMRVHLQVQKSELAEAVQHIHELATHDELTGLPNRRYMQDMLRLEETRARHSGQPLLVAQFDLDFFKAINDSHGHAAGDQVLQSFARQVEASVRGSDIWARWGGEEFVLLMANTSQDDGAQLLEYVRAKIAATPAVLSSGIQVSYTVSIGAAMLEEDEGAVTLLERTDAALYEAKHRAATGWNGPSRSQRLILLLRAASSAPLGRTSGLAAPLAPATCKQGRRRKACNAHGQHIGRSADAAAALVYHAGRVAACQ